MHLVLLAATTFTSRGSSYNYTVRYKIEKNNANKILQKNIFEKNANFTVYTLYMNLDFLMQFYALLIDLVWSKILFPMNEKKGFFLNEV